MLITEEELPDEEGQRVVSRPVKKPRVHRNVWAVTFTSFLTDISSEMLFNLLPIYLFSVLGVRTGLIGLIEGAAESAASLLKMVSGWVSDRVGRRKPLALAGYALSGLVKPMLYFVTGWGGAFAVRFGDRVGKGLRTAPRDALVADSVRSEQRGLAFGLHRAGDTAGAVIGIALALAIILRQGGLNAELSRTTFQTIVLLSAIPAFAAVLVLAIGAHEKKPGEPRDEDAPEDVGVAAESRSRLVDNRPFRLFLIIMVVFTLGNSSDAFLILRAQNAGLSTVGVLGMMLSFNLVYSLLSTPAGALSDRFGRRELLRAGWLVFALTYLGFALADSGWQTWLLMIAYGVYYALSEGIVRAYLADLVPRHQLGTAYGALHAATGITTFPASLLAGILWQGFGGWQGFGPSAPFFIGAGLALCALVLLRFMPAAGIRSTSVP
jgi:MFS family permease